MRRRRQPLMRKEPRRARRPSASASSSPSRSIIPNTPPCSAWLTASSHVSATPVVTSSHHGLSLAASVDKRSVTKVKRSFNRSVTERSELVADERRREMLEYQAPEDGGGRAVGGRVKRSISAAARSPADPARSRLACASSVGSSVFAWATQCRPGCVRSRPAPVSFSRWRRCDAEIRDRCARYGSGHSSPSRCGYPGGAGRWLAVTMTCSGGSAVRQAVEWDQPVHRRRRPSVRRDRAVA